MTSRLLAALLGAFLFAAVAVPARAGAPSSECKQGATMCRDAVAALEACQAKAADAADACKAEKTAADDACMATTATCHNDGSREPPARH